MRKFIFKQQDSKMSTPLDHVQHSVLNQTKILSLMKESRIYWQARKEVMKELIKGRQDTSQPSLEEITKLLHSTEHADKINGLINNCLQKSTKRIPVQKDPSPEIDASRIKWSDMMVKQFNNMAGKMLREEEYDEEDQSVAYIYDPSTLLEYLSSLKSKSGIKMRDSPIFMFPEDTVKTTKFQQIRSKYSFLLMQENIVGGDQDNDLREREKKARKIADGENISNDIEQYLSLGCVTGERVNVYKRYFECFYQYSGKRVEFSLYERIWKPLIRSDMTDIMNSEIYFVFKEEITKMFKIFLCDRQMAQMVKIKQLSPAQAHKLDKYAPIHNILPCKSFSIYMAPFCYTSTDVEDIYEVFQQVYANYFVLLNTVSSLPDSILSLSMLFEELLWSTEKKIVYKLEELHIQPIRLVFPWLFYCFINYIEPEQFFLLLDRIIGTQSLEILPLYCMSIFFKQKSNILGAKNQAEVQEILEDSLRNDIFLETIRDYFKYHL